MKQEYKEWIDSTVPEYPLGLCAEFTEKMHHAFPELKRVRGHYIDPLWGDRSHWWCVAPDGSIVDPTASQFPTKGTFEYVEHVEGDAEPSGRCMNCRGYVYNGDTFCSQSCESVGMADFI